MFSQRYKNLFILLLISVSSFAGETDFNVNLQRAYQEVFQLKINQSKELVRAENPSNIFRIFVEDRIEMVELLASENEKKYDLLAQNEEKRLDLLENVDENSPYNRMLRAEIKLNWALLKIKFGHEVKAGWNVIQAYKLLEENQKLYPKFLPTYKALGCLHILFGSVPENQQWILRFLGLQSNISLGLNEIEKVTTDKIWGLETRFCKAFIKTYVLKPNENSNAELRQLIDSQPDNMAFQFLGTAASLKDNRAEQAFQYFKKWKNGGEYIKLPVYHLYEGEVNLVRANYQQAIVGYQNYLKEFLGKSFVKDAYFRIAVSYLFIGNEKMAKEMILKIGKTGNTITEIDKSAQKFYEDFVKEKEFPHKNILKARFQFDGGYYDKALDELNTISETKLGRLKEKTEYNYRLGRVYQKLNQPEKAIGYFVRTMALNAENEWYFGASSALQLGYIYQAKNQKNIAKSYFEKAISYKKHEFKNSTDNKAKAALSSL